jgi:hypothetical protein
VSSRTTRTATLPGVVVGLSAGAAGGAGRDTTLTDIRLLLADARHPGAGEDSGEKAGGAGHH